MCGSDTKLSVLQGKAQNRLWELLYVHLTTTSFTHRDVCVPVVVVVTIFFILPLTLTTLPNMPVTFNPHEMKRI